MNVIEQQYNCQQSYSQDRDKDMAEYLEEEEKKTTTHIFDYIFCT